MTNFRVGDRVVFNQDYNCKATVNTKGVVERVESTFSGPHEALIHVRLATGDLSMVYAKRLTLEKDETTIQAINWILAANEEVRKAGGVPMAVIEDIPPKVLRSLIANNLYLKYLPDVDKG